MMINVYVEDKTYPIEVPQYVIDEGDDFFAMIDRDIGSGCQMSRTWVENPSVVQRCQFAADRILTALHTENEKSAVMMAGYILARMPQVTGIRMDIEGDMLEHELIVAPHGA